MLMDNNDFYDNELHVDLRDAHEVREIGDALNTLIDKIKSTDNCDDHLTAAALFYDSAYRRGYNAGLKEGKKEEVLEFIEDNRPTEINTDWERGCAYVMDEIENILTEKEK